MVLHNSLHNVHHIEVQNGLHIKLQIEVSDIRLKISFQIEVHNRL